MSGPTTFKVTEKLGPLGTLAKLPIDYREAFLDFTRWLGQGETLVSIEQHGIVVDPAPSCNGSWSVAFDCGCCVSATTSDSNPLQVLSASVLPGNIKARVSIAQGTPGLTYAVSFLAVVMPTYRRKSIDLLVCVGIPMVDIQLPTPPTTQPPFQYVTDDTDLLEGSYGSIFVTNSSGHAITITLPPYPVPNQNLVIKDILGNSSTYNITIDTTGHTIDGAATLVLNFDYSWAELTFTGIEWVQV